MLLQRPKAHGVLTIQTRRMISQDDLSMMLRRQQRQCARDAASLGYATATPRGHAQSGDPPPSRERLMRWGAGRAHSQQSPRKWF